jgi:hypothetical protein
MKYYAIEEKHETYPALFAKIQKGMHHSAAVQAAGGVL